MGDYLFSDSKFIDKLAGNRTLFQKIYDEIKYLYKAATGKELTAIEKVKKEFDRAWKELEKKGAEAFVENRDSIKFSISEIVGEDGNSYGNGVKLDSTLLDNLSDSDRIGIIKEYVKELGGTPFTAYDGNGKKVEIKIAEPGERFLNKNGKITPVNKDLVSKHIRNETKQEAIALVDELVATSNFENNKPSKYPHGWLDDNGNNNWEYWKTYVQDKNNTVWEVTLNVATSTDGTKYLYDISPIKKVGRSVKSDTLPTDTTVPQKAQSVNTSISEKLKNDTGKAQNSLSYDDKTATKDSLSNFAFSAPIRSDIKPKTDTPIKDIGPVRKDIAPVRKDIGPVQEDTTPAKDTPTANIFQETRQKYQKK